MLLAGRGLCSSFLSPALFEVCQTVSAQADGKNSHYHLFKNIMPRPSQDTTNDQWYQHNKKVYFFINAPNLSQLVSGTPLYYVLVE
jgi:hypothetical protein